jgi:hypothetical protein
MSGDYQAIAVRQEAEREATAGDPAITGALVKDLKVETRVLQVASSFTSTPLNQTLQAFILKTGIADELSFAQYAQMAEYMLGPAVDSSRIVGTLVMVRVEDLLRADLKSSAVDPAANIAQVRENLRVRVDEFLTHLGALSSRGKPVWFLACPSTGWLSERHKLEALCRTYMNLLTARVRNMRQVTMITWPTSLLPNEFNDRSADRLGWIPFTPDAFDLLGRFLGQEIERTGVKQPPDKSPTPFAAATELAAYLSGLRVHVRILGAKAGERPHVDRILRTAAAFSLSGEKRDLSESEVDALLDSGRCMLVSVSDRLSNHGPSGVIAFHLAEGSLVVDAMALSCPVLGKQVEYAVISGLAQIASARQCAKVVFVYRPSGRNQIMLTFLKTLTDAESDTRYVLPVDLAQRRIEKAAVAAGTWILDFGT